MSASKFTGAEGFKRAFNLVGGHGLFQWKLLGILSLQRIILTWHHIGYAFLGKVPDHWCLIPELKYQSNWTVDEIKQISIPHIINPENPDKWLYNKCEYYNLNYTSLLESSSSFEDVLSKVDFQEVSTAHCMNWEYDRSIYQSTVATQFDLVCENRWMAATIQGSYMAAGIIGTLTFGSLSDRVLGRRRAVLISLALVIVGGVVASFSTSYWMFLLFRMIISLGVNGCVQNCYILVTENVDTKYRALLSFLETVPFAIGYMILPALAYNFRRWDSLQFSFGLISIGLVVYYWILPDSPRWLATHGHTDKAIDCLNKIAKQNKRPEPNRQDLMDIVKQCHYEHKKTERNKQQDIGAPDDQGRPENWITCLRRNLLSLAHNFRNLMRTKEIRRRSVVLWMIFFTVAVVYYGIAFSGHLTSDPYLLVFLGGLMEIPAYTIIVPFVSKFGRKPTISANFILTGTCMLVLTIISREYDIARLVLAMLAKLCVTSSFAITYLMSAELYPTELRMTGLACGVFMGRVGSIIAPYIVDLMHMVYRDLPSLIFGGMAIFGGIVSLLLPETRTLEMSDKITEIEEQQQQHSKAEDRNENGG